MEFKQNIFKNRSHNKLDTAEEKIIKTKEGVEDIMQKKIRESNKAETKSGSKGLRKYNVYKHTVNKICTEG